MPLAHLLWRLSEGKSAALSVAVSCRCTWPMCPTDAVDVTLRVAAKDTKPHEVHCPLCRKTLRVFKPRHDFLFR